jgi:hypothetical protein
MFMLGAAGKEEMKKGMKNCRHKRRGKLITHFSSCFIGKTYANSILSKGYML